MESQRKLKQATETAASPGYAGSLTGHVQRHQHSLNPGDGEVN